MRSIRKVTDVEDVWLKKDYIKREIEVEEAASGPSMQTVLSKIFKISLYSHRTLDGHMQS